MPDATTRETAYDRCMTLDVLIVEDDADIREVLCGILAESGHTVRESPDGAEALAFLRGRAPPDRPCLVLVDLFVPGMSGADLVDAMRRSDVLASIPVALMTGDAKACRVACAPHVVRVLPKPFDLEAPFALVDEFCPTGRPTTIPAG